MKTVFGVRVNMRVVLILGLSILVFVEIILAPITTSYPSLHTPPPEPPVTTPQPPVTTPQPPPPPPPLFINDNTPPSKKGICVAFRSETGLTILSNADRVRLMSIAAVTHLGKFNLLEPRSFWKDEGGVWRIQYPVLSRAISDSKCEWVVLVELNVIMVPSALQSLTSLLAEAKGDVVLFHSVKSTRRIDMRVMAFRGTSTSTPILEGVDNAAEFEKRVFASGGASLASISTVMKLAPTDHGMFPFEIARMPRSVEVCTSMIGNVFVTFTPSTLPMSCAKLSPASCWTTSCENSADLLFPLSENATMCIINSEGDSGKSVNLRPLNFLSWEYYTTVRGYKLHSYYPKEGGRDRHLYRSYWTKINLLTLSLQDPDCKWVMWADDDSVVMNSNVTLESIIAEYTSEVPDAAVMVPYENYHNLVNNGVFLIKRNELGARFAMQWRYIRESGTAFLDRFWDQGEMIHLFSLPEFAPYVVLVPQFSFNAYYTAIAKQTTFHPQKSLLLHYPGDIYNLNKTIPSCGGILNHDAIDVLGNVSRYEFCQGFMNVLECFEKRCRNVFQEIVHPPLEVRVLSREMCVITPANKYTSTSNMITITERQCPGCSFHPLPDNDPHDGSLPTSFMLEVSKRCTWTIYPIDGCFSHVLSLRKLLTLPSDKVVVMGEDSTTNSSATGFVAVRGSDILGVMFLRHYALFNTLHNSEAAFPVDLEGKLHTLGSSHQFAPQVVKVRSGGTHCSAGSF